VRDWLRAANRLLRALPWPLYRRTVILASSERRDNERRPKFHEPSKPGQDTASLSSLGVDRRCNSMTIKLKKSAGRRFARSTNHHTRPLSSRLEVAPVVAAAQSPPLAPCARSADPNAADALHELFFLQGEEFEGDLSEPPTVPDLASDGLSGESVRPVVVAAAAASRRRTLRKMVASVLASATLLVLFGGAKVAAKHRQQPPLRNYLSHQAASQASPITSALYAPITPAADILPASASSPRLAASNEPPAAAPVAASNEPFAEASSSESAHDSTGSVAKLLAGSSSLNPRKEAERLLNLGRMKEAASMSEAAIESDPDDAMGYLFLGTALQSSGRWKDGLEAYCRCVHRAKKGPVGECRAVGGH